MRPDKLNIEEGRGGEKEEIITHTHTHTKKKIVFLEDEDLALNFQSQRIKPARVKESSE